MSSKPPHIYQGCLRKIAFKSLDKAIKHAKKWNQRYYYCACCLSYHLTKSEHNSLTPEPIKVPKRLVLVNNKSFDIMKEDDEYYYLKVSNKNRYMLLNLGWELVDEGMRLKKVLLEKKGIKVIWN